MSDERALPRHIAIIMDGNGRWARERGWARIRGHRAGVTSVRESATYCAELGIGQLTLYAFSTENWKRPKREVDLLFTLLRRFLIKEYRTIMDNRIVLTSIGDVEALPASVTDELYRVQQASADNGGMTLCLALNYGARHQMTRYVDGTVTGPAAAAAFRTGLEFFDVEGVCLRRSSHSSEAQAILRSAGFERSTAGRRHEIWVRERPARPN